MKQFLFLITFVFSSLNYFAQTDSIITKNNKVTIGTITNVNDTCVFYTDKAKKPNYILLKNITFYVKSGETIIPSPIAVSQVTTTIIQPIEESTFKVKLSIGVHGGPAGSTFIGNREDQQQWGYEIKPRLGYISGINFQYQVKPKFALKVEVNYESKGAMFTFYNVWSAGPLGSKCCLSWNDQKRIHHGHYYNPNNSKIYFK